MERRCLVSAAPVRAPCVRALSYYYYTLVHELNRFRELPTLLLIGALLSDALLAGVSFSCAWTTSANLSWAHRRIAEIPHQVPADDGCYC